MYLANGRAAVIDLGSGQVEEVELHEDQFLGQMSAIELGKSLSKENGGALVLGSGLLAGSLIPAACAGFVIAPGDGDGPRVSMLLGYAGVELKLSGFDFLVLSGVAPEPGYVWVRDGIAEFVPDSNMKSMNSWARTDRVRSEQGDKRIQVVTTGPWGDVSHPASRYIVNHWLAEDVDGCGGRLGKLGAMAICFRGMGELELAEPARHFDECMSVQKRHLSGLGPNKGLASYWEGASANHFSELLHRTLSCYSCPFPCRSYLKTREDPHTMALVEAEPGYLHYDTTGLKRAFEMGLNSVRATEVISTCARAGADALSVLDAAGRSGDTSSSAVEALLSRPDDVAAQSHDVYGDWLSTGKADRATFERCLSLGLCPRYWSLVGLDLSPVTACVESALGADLE